MALIRIGTTCSGKDLVMEGTPLGANDLTIHCEGFSDHDLFDFAVALDCLHLAERRRNIDPDWAEWLQMHLSVVEERAGPQVIQRVREELGIVSAFAARDHGKKCLATHFRG